MSLRLRLRLAETLKAVVALRLLPRQPGLDDLRRVGRDHVHAEHAVGRGVDHQLQQHRLVAAAQRVLHRPEPGLEDPHRVAARARLAAFLSTRPERLGLVENATAGVNAVLRSIDWQAGDELVLADHAYLAVRHTVQHLAERHGLVVRLVQVAFPLSGPEAILEAYWSAITPRTRLVIVDHIFSTLAVQALNERRRTNGLAA